MPDKMPDFIPPMLATLVAAPFDDPGWQFEIKWDGFRVETVVKGADVRLWTRGQQDAARYFGTFLDPPSWIGAKEAIVDGEVIALDDHGEPDFALLQARIKGRGALSAEPTPFVYEVFDLLSIDGESLLEAPLEERRRRLKAALRTDPRVRLSEDIVGDGIGYGADEVRRVRSRGERDPADHRHGDRAQERGHRPRRFLRRHRPPPGLPLLAAGRGRG